ncbi:DNA polymerase III subunit epsilon [Rufibacter immobilis]|uniref:DNA polymerase III subunit epsilon n=1 Tax=Rufibacter immobilis TaxID=1348778 RepID=A0A3M9N3P9_9BACT|nr:3'-5' exonuclease [Rufibacter immobilis]RNI32015.1 DNA polymerase III subunit epsilon [Rufibacter immobilis]
MNFITLDFETATPERDSPCEIGLTFVRNGQIAETESWLIKPKSYPYFNGMNISIHGIKPQDVKNSPEFDQLWRELHPLLQNQLVIAHNASFDMSVLRATLNTYRLPFPELHYACSVQFSKQVWQGLPQYDLKSLCNRHGIQFKHHRAAADSYACAELTLRALEQVNCHHLTDFPEKLKINPGRLFAGGYTASSVKKAPRRSTSPF